MILNINHNNHSEINPLGGPRDKNELWVPHLLPSLFHTPPTTWTSFGIIQHTLIQEIVPCNFNNQHSKRSYNCILHIPKNLQNRTFRVFFYLTKAKLFRPMLFLISSHHHHHHHHHHHQMFTLNLAKWQIKR